MKCELADRHLSAYVDGELDAGSAVEFDLHLSECPACRSRLALERLVKQQVKEHLGAARAPESLRLVICDELAAAPHQVEYMPRRSILLGLAAAAAIALGVFGSYQGLGVRKPSESGVAESSMTLPIFEDVVDRHTHEQPVDIQGSEPERVAVWFRGKVRFPVRPVEFQSPQVRFVGAGLSHVRERQAVTLYYNVGGRRLTMVVFEAPIALSQGAQRAVIGGRELYYHDVYGYTVPVIQRNSIAYAFTADMDRGSLLRVVATARVP